MAVDNNVVLELGVTGLGIPAENLHVGPMHPEYAELPAQKHDPVAAKAMLDAAGHGETELELISIDRDWRIVATVAIGGQMRDAGFNIKRTIYPGSSFWNDWSKYPFSTTNWLHHKPGRTPTGLFRCWGWPTARARHGTNPGTPTLNSTPNSPKRRGLRMQTNIAP